MQVKLSESPIRNRLPPTHSPLSKSQLESYLKPQRIKTQIPNPPRHNYLNEISAKIQVMQQKIKGRSDYVSPNYLRSSERMSPKINLNSSSKFNCMGSDQPLPQEQLRSSFQDGFTINLFPEVEKETSWSREHTNHKNGLMGALEIGKPSASEIQEKQKGRHRRQKEGGASQKLQIPLIEGLNRENQSMKAIFLSTQLGREELKQYHKISKSRNKEVGSTNAINKSAVQSKTTKNLQPFVPNDKITNSINKSLSVIEMVKNLQVQKKPKKPKVAIEKQYCKQFEMGIILGKGKFGEVFLGKHTVTGFIVALKKVLKSKLLEYNIVEQFIKEIKLHNSMNHPNIDKFYGFFQEKDSFYLVLEYMNGGTLFDYLNVVGKLKIKETVQFLKDIIDAISYMHQRSIAHRDIKPENIVVSTEGVAKLCDLGWAAIVESTRKTYCGTLDYACPEVLQRKAYDISVDIWSIGILTYQMLMGRAPFEDKDRSIVRERIVNSDNFELVYGEDVPQQAREFIEWLVQRDPSRRPKISELLSHKMFTVYYPKPSKKAL